MQKVLINGLNFGLKNFVFLLTVLFLLFLQFFSQPNAVLASEWSPTVNISNNTGISDYPQIVIESDGTKHAVWHDNTGGGGYEYEIYYATQPLGGSWSTPVNLSNMSGRSLSPQLALGPDNTLYVLWGDEISAHWFAFLRSKPKEGVWSSPENVTAQFTQDALGASITVDQWGTLNILYATFDNKIYYIQRLFGGNWSSPEVVSNLPGGSEVKVDSQGNIHAAIQQVINDVPHVFYTQKPLGGSWTTPIPLSDITSSRSASQPRLVIDNANNLHVAWHGDAGTDASRLVMYTSKPSNGNWSIPEALPNGYGLKPSIAVDSQRKVHAVWVGGFNGQRSLLYANKSEGGAWILQSNLYFASGYSDVNPWIVFDPSETIMVAWVGDSDDLTNSEIYVNSIPRNNPPTASAGGPYSVPEGGSVALTGSGIDPDGDPLTFAWDLDNNGTFETSGQNVTFSAAERDGPSSQNIALRVCDPSDVCATASALVEITNAPPTITGITVPQDPQQAGTSVAVSATFADPGAADTHTASWLWGDGSTSSGSVSPGAVGGSHIYADAGVYLVSLTVTDDDGGSSTVSALQYIVIFDPTAGFVTGAGAIDSPEGAFPQEPSLSGRAHFGFSVKYLPGDSQPNGGSQFKFRIASIDFASTSYQWLVISGTKAAFQGVGTNNGAGNYTFIVSAIDGQPDKYRIKITDNITNVVFYDNEIGIPETADPITSLTNGNIVIH